MDFTLHFALIVDHDHALTGNLAFDVRVDADQAGGDFYLSLDLHARLEPADPVAVEIRSCAAWNFQSRMASLPPAGVLADPGYSSRDEPELTENRLNLYTEFSLL